jgi:hypothetical protein
MQAQVNGTVSGIGAGDSINQIEIVWKTSSGEVESTAVAAGRGITLTSNVDKANFSQTPVAGQAPTAAGYQLTSVNLVSGTTYWASVRITENKSGGGAQTGAWSTPYSFVATTGTTTTAAAPGSNIILNGGFETGGLTSWVPYLVSASAGYLSVSSAAGDKNGGNYGLKLTVPTGTSQQYFAVAQTITSNFDALNNFSFDYKIVSAECTATTMTDTLGTPVFVAFKVFDSGATNLIDLIAYPQADSIRIAFDQTVLLAGIWNIAPGKSMDTWYTFSHQDVKAWLLSHFKADKTWADAASVIISIEGGTMASSKIGYRVDNMKTGA